MGNDFLFRAVAKVWQMSRTVTFMDAAFTVAL